MFTNFRECPAHLDAAAARHHYRKTIMIIVIIITRAVTAIARYHRDQVSNDGLDAAADAAVVAAVAKSYKLIMSTP